MSFYIDSKGLLAEDTINLFSDIVGFKLIPRYGLKGDNIFSKFTSLMKIWYSNKSIYDSISEVPKLETVNYLTFEMKLGKEKLYVRQYVHFTKNNSKGDYIIYTDNGVIDVITSNNVLTVEKSDLLSEIREIRLKKILG